MRALFSALLHEMIPGTRSAVMSQLEHMDTTWTTGQKIRYLLEKLGWAKVGQLLSVSPLMPPDVRAELAHLQDELPPSTKTEIELELRTQLGGFYEQIESFEYPPVKSGSIGEVVKAKLRDGRTVAIKVVTQGRRKAIDATLVQLHNAANAMERAGFGNVYGFHLGSTAHDIGQMLGREMNLRNEYGEYRTYGELPQGITRPDLADGAPPSSSVLVMEWIEGRKLTPLSVGEENLSRAVDQLSKLAGKPFVDGCFQADPHPGNFMVASDGGLVMLDFGRTQCVREEHLDNVLRLAVGLMADGRDQGHAIARALIAMNEREAPLPANVEDTLAPRVEAIMADVGDLGEISTSTFLALLGEACAVGVEVDPAYKYLFVYYATLEGTMRTLKPEYRLVGELTTVLTDYAKRRFPGTDIEKSLTRGEVPHDGRLLFTTARLKRGLLSCDTEGAVYDTVIGLISEIKTQRGFFDLRYLATMLAEAESSMAGSGYEERFQDYLHDEIERAYPGIDAKAVVTNPTRIDDHLTKMLDDAIVETRDAVGRQSKLNRNLLLLRIAFDAQLLHAGSEPLDAFKLLSRIIARVEATCSPKQRTLFRAAFFEEFQKNEFALAHLAPLREQIGQLERLRTQLDAMVESSEGQIPLHHDLTALRQILQDLQERTLQDGASREDFATCFRQFTERLQQLLDTHGEALSKLVVRYRTRLPGIVPTMLVYFSETDLDRIAKEHNIPREAMADVIGLATSTSFSREMEALISTRLTPEAVETWLATDEGQRFLRLHRDELRNRMRTGGPGLMVGVLRACSESLK